MAVGTLYLFILVFDDVLGEPEGFLIFDGAAIEATLLREGEFG